MTNACGTCCLLFLALFAPPIAVAIHMGCGCDMCINFLLTCLFYFPGLIHSWIIILTKQRDDCRTVVHVHQAAPAPAPVAAPTAMPVVVLQAPAPVYPAAHYPAPAYTQDQCPYPVQQLDPCTVKGTAPPQYQ